MSSDVAFTRVCEHKLPAFEWQTFVMAGVFSARQLLWPSVLRSLLVGPCEERRLAEQRSRLPLPDTRVQGEASSGAYKGALESEFV